MSDSHASVTVSAAPVSPIGIQEFFGIDKTLHLEGDLLADINTIKSFLYDESVDSGSAAGVLRGISFLAKVQGDAPTRVRQALKYMSMLKSKGVSLKDMEIVNVEDLEEYAKSTGNWMPFLKKTSDVKKALYKK